MSLTKHRKKTNGFIISILIIILPQLLFLHLLFDDEDTSMEIFGFIYNHGFQGTQTFIYIILTTLIPIILISIWYLESINWFKWLILLSIFPWIDNSIRYSYTDKSNLQFLVFSIMVSTAYFFLLNLIKKKFLKNPEKFDIKTTNLLKIDSDLLSISAVETSLMELDKKTSNALKILVHLDSLISDRPFKSYVNNSKFKKKDIAVLALLLISSLSLYGDYLFYKYPIIVDYLNLSSNLYNFNTPLTLVYFFGLKMAILIPLLIWFFTSPYWWRYALLSPILLNVFQIWEALQNTTYADEISFYYAAPWILLITAILLYMDKKVSYATFMFYSKNEIQKQIDNIINSKEYSNNQFSRNKADFEKIKSGEIISDKTKLEELIRIREELLKNI
jgi:hypothetical protein